MQRRHRHDVPNTVCSRQEKARSLGGCGQNTLPTFLAIFLSGPTFVPELQALSLFHGVGTSFWIAGLAAGHDIVGREFRGEVPAYKCFGGVQQEEKRNVFGGRRGELLAAHPRVICAVQLGTGFIDWQPLAPRQREEVPSQVLSGVR